MAALSKESIQTLVQLSRINCSEQEQAGLLKDLAKILVYIEQLQDIDTENVLPCNQVLEGAANVMREDIPTASILREDALMNAPDHTEKFYRVPKIIE